MMDGCIRMGVSLGADFTHRADTTFLCFTSYYFNSIHITSLRKAGGQVFTVRCSVLVLLFLFFLVDSR